MTGAAKFYVVSGKELVEKEFPGALQREGAYRRGYSQGYALAVQDLEQLLHRRSAPACVSALNDHVDALYRWRRKWRDGMDHPPMLVIRKQRTPGTRKAQP